MKSFSGVACDAEGPAEEGRRPSPDAQSIAGVLSVLQGSEWHIELRDGR